MALEPGQRTPRLFIDHRRRVRGSEAQRGRHDLLDARIGHVHDVGVHVVIRAAEHGIRRDWHAGEVRDIGDEAVFGERHRVPGSGLLGEQQSFVRHQASGARGAYGARHTDNGHDAGEHCAGSIACPTTTQASTPESTGMASRITSGRLTPSSTSVWKWRFRFSASPMRWRIKHPSRLFGFR
jgi:hypothetical protein